MEMREEMVPVSEINSQWVLAVLSYVCLKLPSLSDPPSEANILSAFRRRYVLLVAGKMLIILCLTLHTGT